MSQKKALSVVDDILFIAHIQEVAKSQGTPLVCVKNPEECLSQLSSDPEIGVVFFDLNSRTFDSNSLVDALVSGDWINKVRVVGFVRHADEAKIRSIREKGCREILARSAFVKQLPELLSSRS